MTTTVKKNGNKKIIILLAIALAIIAIFGITVVSIGGGNHGGEAGHGHSHD